MNPNYPNGEPITMPRRDYHPSLSKTDEENCQDMKKICQLLHLGLCRVMDDMDKEGANVKEALFRMKLLAQQGAHKIYPGASFKELIEFDNHVKADLAHPFPKKVFFLQTKINGKTNFQAEDQGGNVGPVVEPGAKEMQEKTEAVISQIKVKEIEVAHD